MGPVDCDTLASPLRRTTSLRNCVHYAPVCIWGLICHIPRYLRSIGIPLSKILGIMDMAKAKLVYLCLDEKLG